MRKFSVTSLTVLTVLFVFGIIFYYRSGAFEEPEIKVMSAPSYTIAGTFYKGKPQSREFGKLFNEADKLVEQKKLSGTVCGVYYTNPENGNEETEAFIGIILSDTSQPLPQEYTRRYLPARQVIQAHVANGVGSPLVYPKIEDFAKEKKIAYKPIPALEIYPSSREVFVQVPVDGAVK